MIIYLYMAIPLFKVFMSEDVIEPVNNVLRSGYVTQNMRMLLEIF